MQDGAGVDVVDEAICVDVGVAIIFGLVFNMMKDIWSIPMK